MVPVSAADNQNHATYMNNQQRELARHALGLPNRDRESYRNHYCAEPGGDGYQDWLDMARAGLARKRTRGIDVGLDTFHLTLRGAILAIDPGEDISQEDMRNLVLLETRQRPSSVVAADSLSAPVPADHPRHD